MHCLFSEHFTKINCSSGQYTGFSWLCHVACGRDLSSPTSDTVEAWSTNHWTTREVSQCTFNVYFEITWELHKSCKNQTVSSHVPSTQLPLTLAACGTMIQLSRLRKYHLTSTFEHIFLILVGLCELYLFWILSSFTEKGMVTHCSIPAWRISWTEEPGGLQSMGSQRAGHEWAINTHTHFNHFFPSNF